MFIGGVHIGARALLDHKLIWFGYITRLSQWGEGGNFLVQIIYAVTGLGGGGQHPVVGIHRSGTHCPRDILYKGHDVQGT